jgi:hypothetical protein
VICPKGKGPARYAHPMQHQADGTMTVSVAVDARVTPPGYQEQSSGVIVVDRHCGPGLRMFNSQLIESEIAVPIIVAKQECASTLAVPMVSVLARYHATEHARAVPLVRWEKVVSANDR